MASSVLWFLVFLQVVYGNQEYRSDGLIDRLSSGMKYATDFLGSESVALRVAEFVVRAFQNVNNPHPSPNRRRPVNDAYIEDATSEESSTHEKEPDLDMDEAPNNPLTPLRHLVRLFGLQPNQISAVAVNALVFVAQMISTFLAGPKHPNRSYRSDDPTTWLLNKNSQKLQDLITTARNNSLPDVIEKLIKEQGPEEETSCIRLLVCKITPFVFKMQEAVFGNDNQTNDDVDMKKIRGSAALYRHLPSVKEIEDRNDICERQHKDCDLNE